MAAQQHTAYNTQSGLFWLQEAKEANALLFKSAHSSIANPTAERQRLTTQLSKHCLHRTRPFAAFILDLGPKSTVKEQLLLFRIFVEAMPLTSLSYITGLSRWHYGILLMELGQQPSGQHVYYAASVHQALDFCQMLEVNHEQNDSNLSKKHLRQQLHYRTFYNKQLNGLFVTKVDLILRDLSTTTNQSPSSEHEAIAQMPELLRMALAVRATKKQISQSILQQRFIEDELAERHRNSFRAHLNPHFLFNYLNSIRLYILDNDIKEAHKHLLRFANFMLLTLNNSNVSSLSLGQEIKYLKKYLDLEQLRFGGKFTYIVALQPLLEHRLDQIAIPPMLMQPLLEKIVWHQLMPNKQKGLLKIDFNVLTTNTLQCTISDNGIGLKKADENRKRRKRSTDNFDRVQRRILLLNKLNQNNIQLTATDQINEGLTIGSIVELRIPITA